MIPVFSNSLGIEEVQAVDRVMHSRWLGMGPECQSFEDELAAYFNVERILLTNCATSGLYLAVRTLDLGPDDEVILPTIHFVACASAVLEAGGKPVFADVDPHTLNITAREIEKRRTSRTWGVILNHYGGHPADMTNILAAASGLMVIEDAANAPASRYHGKAVGTFGDAGVWSFDSMKILCMGDGGALWFYRDHHDKRAWRLRNLGLDAFSGAEKAKTARNRWWEYSVKEPSGRFDSNDILAAIGRVQLKKLPGFVARRKAIWETYQAELAGVGDLVLPPEPLSGCTSSYYLYWVQTGRRDELARFLYDQGVYCNFRYFPLHWAFKFPAVRLPYAEQVAEVTLCLPCHQNLTDEQQAWIVDLVRTFYHG